MYSGKLLLSLSNKTSDLSDDLVSMEEDTGRETEVDVNICFFAFMRRPYVFADECDVLGTFLKIFNSERQLHE